MVLGSSPVAVTSPSDFAPASSKEFLDIQATIERGFTLKRVRDMTRTYSQLDNAVLKDFYNLYNLTNLISKATCYKNPNNPSCIDLLLTNFPKCFQNSCVIETGLSDSHKMVVTVMKTNLQKLEPKIINYRNYRYLSNDRFREKVTSELSKVVFENSDKGFNKFLDVCKEALNMYAPLKKKYIRGNNSPFMNRILSKEIMKRSRLRNKFLKSKSEADKKNYVKQRNYLFLCLGERPRNTMEI